MEVTELEQEEEPRRKEDEEKRSIEEVQELGRV